MLRVVLTIFTQMGTPQGAHVRAGMTTAAGFGLLALVLDQVCDHFKRTEQKYQEALSDGAAHIATALAVAMPAAPFVRNRRSFVLTAVISAVAIDLDHVVVARSTNLIPCMSMPHRPASHSVVTVGALTYLAERIWPDTQTDFAIVLGLGSHLLRDLATGGAPLFIPKRIVEITRPPVVTLMVLLGFFGRWYARHMLNPNRRRRSNQTALAPEALLVGSRALRARRSLAATNRPSRAA